MGKWRFIDSGYCGPYYNMGLDKTLFDSFCPEKSLPLFRIYRWIRPAISLGRFQDYAQVLAVDNCRRDKVAVVKRITGGAAIYHTRGELTYSLVCPACFFKTYSVKESYRRITGFIIKAYKRLGLRPSYAKASGRGKSRPGQKVNFCFAGLEEYDILINGRKIGGNAQKRRKGVIFQHGSIPFFPSAGPDNYFLKKEGSKNKYLSLAEAGIGDFANFKKVLIDSFADNLDLELFPDKISRKEEELAGKYKNWLLQDFGVNRYAADFA